MDESKFVDYMPLLVVGGIILLNGVLPPEYSQLTGIGGFGFILLWIFFLDVYLVKRASPYGYISAVVRMPEETVRVGFFVSQHRPMEAIPGGFSEYCVSPWPIKDIDYIGPFTDFVMNMKAPWNTEIVYQHGKAFIMGTPVDHPNVAYVEMEMTEDFDLNRGDPIPVFKLVRSPGDYYNDPLKNPAQMMGMDELTKGIPFKDAFKEEFGEKYPTVQSYIDWVKGKWQEAERGKSTWYQDSLKWENIAKKRGEENEALRRAGADAPKMAQRLLYDVVEINNGIEGAARAKALGGVNWLKGLGWLMWPIIVIAVVVYLYYTGAWKTFDKWVSTGGNAWSLIALVAVGAIGAYLFFKYIRGRG